MKKRKMLGFFVLPLCFSLELSASQGRDDYDVDDDGLIEIYDWDDLNEIRNNLDGSSLYGNSQGCPGSGCFGFELQSDLNFDTNGDGILNSQDLYWNDGAGWQPISQIGKLDDPFTAVFQGNYHIIKNLYIDRPEESQVALFGFVTGAEFYNLSVVLSDQGISARAGAAILVADAGSTQLENIALKGRLSADTTAAAAVASASYVVLKHVMADVNITVRRHGGGLIGWGAHGGGANLEGCYTIGAIKSDGDSYLGGLISTSGVNYPSVISNSYSLINFQVGDQVKVGGLVSGNAEIINSFYSGELSGGIAEAFDGLFANGESGSQKNSYWTSIYNNEEIGMVGGVEGLKCPIEAGDINCGGEPIYVDWPTAPMGGSGGYWDFGDRDSLPRLASLPQGLDKDGNGTPDSWELGCLVSCQVPPEKPDVGVGRAGFLNLFGVFLIILMAVGRHVMSGGHIKRIKTLSVVQHGLVAGKVFKFPLNIYFRVFLAKIINKLIEMKPYINVCSSKMYK